MDHGPRSKLDHILSWNRSHDIAKHTHYIRTMVPIIHIYLPRWRMVSIVDFIRFQQKTYYWTNTHIFITFSLFNAYRGFYFNELVQNIFPLTIFCVL